MKDKCKAYSNLRDTILNSLSHDGKGPEHDIVNLSRAGGGGEVTGPEFGSARIL